jgi:hypothetical protein
MAKLDSVNKPWRHNVGRGRAFGSRNPRWYNRIKGSAGIIYTIVTTLLGFATNRWFAQRYNVNNAWIFNGNTGNLDNNNVYNTNQVGAVTNLSETVITPLWV